METAARHLLIDSVILREFHLEQAGDAAGEPAIPGWRKPCLLKRELAARMRLEGDRGDLP